MNKMFTSISFAAYLLHFPKYHSGGSPGISSYMIVSKRTNHLCNRAMTMIWLTKLQSLASCRINICLRSKSSIHYYDIVRSSHMYFKIPFISKVVFLLPLGPTRAIVHGVGNVYRGNSMDWSMIQQLWFLLNNWLNNENELNLYNFLLISLYYNTWQWLAKNNLIV